MNWITRSAFAILAATAAPMAHAADAQFERIFDSTFTDYLRHASRAYDANHYHEAFELFQRAACAGDKESQSIVGRMYLLGQGTAKDTLTGYAWLRVAAEIQFPGYQRIVHSLENAMNDEQRKIATARANELIDLYGMRATNMSCKAYATRGGHIFDAVSCTPLAEGSLVVLRKCVAGTPGG